MNSREKDKLNYNKQLMQRYQYIPELSRIARHRHVPKSVYIAKHQLNEIRQSKHRKLKTAIKHSKEGQINIEPERSKHIVNTLE